MPFLAVVVVAGITVGEGLIIIGIALQVVAKQTDNENMGKLGQALTLVGGVGGLYNSLAAGAAEGTTVAAGAVDATTAADAAAGVTVTGTGATGAGEAVAGTELAATGTTGSGALLADTATTASSIVDAGASTVQTGAPVPDATGLATDSIVAPSAPTPLAETAQTPGITDTGVAETQGPGYDKFYNNTNVNTQGYDAAVKPAGNLIQQNPTAAMMLSQGIIGAYQQKSQEDIARAKLEEEQRIRDDKERRRREFNTSVLDSRIPLQPWQTTPSRALPVYNTQTAQPAGQRPLISTARRN